MNGWMALSMVLGAMFVPALMALKAAARDYQMVDDALLQMIELRHVEIEEHAIELADKESALQSLIASNLELQDVIETIARQRLDRATDRLLADVLRMPAKSVTHTTH